MSGWLESAFALREVSGSSPDGADTKKSFAEVGDPLTMSFSAGLSKSSGSIHSITTIQSQ